MELCYSNEELLSRLSNYEPKSIAAAFERRMKKEQDVQMKLLSAEIAAENGSPAGRKFIESLAETVDYAITVSRAAALGRLLRSPHPPEWIFDAVHAVLNDTREVTNIPFQGSFNRQINHVAENEAALTYALGEGKSRRSVPVLIEIAKHSDDPLGAITALGMIGDARAIPVCLERLNREIADIKKYEAEKMEVPPSDQLLNALADLRVSAAVPTLLEYVHYPKVVAVLGRMGDERALEPLQKIVGDHGKMDRHPDSQEASTQERFVAARMALIRLEKEDPVP